MCAGKTHLAFTEITTGGLSMIADFSSSYVMQGAGVKCFSFFNMGKQVQDGVDYILLDS